MPDVIHLNAAQAAAVTGPSATDKFARLEPAAMTDGTFILGAQVLADPAHASKVSILKAASVVDVASLASILPVFVMSAVLDVLPPVMADPAVLS